MPDTAMPGTAGLFFAENGRRGLLRVLLPLLVVAALAWVVTARTSMTMGAGPAAFLSSWAVMMAGMMLPAVAPVAALYARAAQRGVVAAVPVFLAGYLVAWLVSGVPAYLVSRVVDDPLMMGRPWVGRLVALTLLAAAAYQFTPLKERCLRHCRSPLGFFLGRGQSLSRPSAAFTAGVAHAGYCFGCCWALMAVLVALGGMQLGWALALAAVITAEKVLPWGEKAARVTALAAAALGFVLLADPALLSHFVTVSA